MKVEAEQLEFTLRPATPEELREEEIQARWRRNEKIEAQNWTSEALCIQWLGNDPLWFHALPLYKQHAWIQRHESARQMAPVFGMPSPGHMIAAEEESYQETKRLAESWAKVLQEDFLAGRPCSIKPAWDYEYVLRWAFEIAAIPVSCLQPAKEQAV